MISTRAQESTVDAPQFVAEAWQMAEGLPDNEVTSVAQAPDGYLWVGTRGGLARFDGIRFEVFKSNTPGLEDSRISKLFFDQQGVLWVSMASGKLSRFTGGQFVSFRGEDGGPEKPVAAFALNSQGEVTLVDTGGAFFAFQGGRFKRELPGETEPPPSLQSWTLDRSGRAWGLDVSHRLLRWTGKRWELVTERGGRAIESIAKASPGRGGGLWVADTTSIRRLEGNRWIGESVAIPVSPESISAMLDDSAGNLWVGTTDSRLFRTRVDRGPSGVRVHDTLSPGAVNDLFEDREGNIWVASAGGGLIRLRRAAFQSFGMADGLPTHPILSIAQETPGRLMVGTQGGGMYVFEGGHFFGPISMLGRSVSVGALLAGKDGGVWVGTGGDGLLKLHGMKSAQWSTSDGLADPAILSLCEERSGVLWVGHPTGLSRFEGNQFTHFTSTNGLLGRAVRALAQDSKGDLWVGTEAGLNRLQNGSFRHWSIAEGLPANQVQSLAIGPQGELWIGTLDGGLSRFKDGRFANYSTRNGLPDDSVTALVEDGLGFLWMGTGRGVCRVALTDLEAVADGKTTRVEAVSYATRDGLASIQFASGHPAGIRSSDGRLWFATGHALSGVNPSQLPRNSIPPPVAIETLSVDGEEVYSNRGGERRGAREAKGPIRLAAGRRHLEIAYTALSLTSPTGTRFCIQLVGAEGMVREVGGRRVAFYDGLSAGTYEFHVTAANSDGVWSTAPASIGFVVAPFYWETLWFRGGVGIGGLVVGVAWLRRRIVRRERERVAETLRLQGAALASAGDGIVITDPAGTIVWTNTAFTRLTGYASDEVIGRNLRELKSSTSLGGDYRAMWDTLADGKVWQSEIEIRNRDGTSSTYERTMTPVRDAKGVITHFIAIYRDIGQRKRMEAELSESEERFRTLALATLEGILIHDTRGILEVNEAAIHLFGYSQNEFLGKSLLDLFEATDRPQASRYLETQSEAPEEFHGVRRDGSVFDLEIQCRPCPFRGRMARVAAVRDVTEVRRVQQRIQQLLQQKALETERSRIARDMHDEMGSSLTRITLLSEAVEMGMDSADESDRAGARARLQRISSLGRSLVASMDEIVWAVNPGNDSLEECASYLCHFAPELLKTAGIQCRLEVPEVFPSRIVSAEVRHNLFLVVKEALHNAVKHSGASVVTLSMEMKGDDLWLTLVDDGRGFDPARSRDRGNGLTNMHQRLASVGGGIELSSAPGRGTRLSIRVRVQG